MGEREFTRMSDDPKDPRWRFRVAEDATGLIVIVEEEMTSTSPTAQPSEVTHIITMTPKQAV